MSLQLDDSNFEQVIASASQPLLVLFESSFCGPSHLMFQLLDESLLDEDRFVYAEVDVEKCPKLAQTHKVRGTPTLMFFWRGELLGSRVGSMSGAYLAAFLDAMVAKTKVDAS